MWIKRILHKKGNNHQHASCISAVKEKGHAGGTSRRVLKIMSLFTGVESLGIICSMVKMKLVAIWLDATGVGLFNIFNTTVDTATYLTGLGLRQSAVRDVAVARGDGGSRLNVIIAAVRGWSVVAGLLGAVALLTLSWPLAEIIFGDGRMWWNFAVLGATMLFNALYAGEAAVFQGTEAYRRLARTGLEMAVAGLLVSVPMFRFLGENSVSLSIAAYGLCGCLFAYINRERRYDIKPMRGQELKNNSAFVKFGAYISITAFFNTLCQLIFVSWLNNVASTAVVGLYGAGMTLVVRYTSMVFNSVGLEYYPRVSANIGHPQRMEVFMNHEVTLLLLVLTPLMLLFMACRELVVPLLYSREFLVIIPFISWGIMTILMRAVSNTLAFTIMAKGEGKVYMAVDSADALFGLAMCVVMYMRYGITGVGIALVIWHAAYMAVVTFVCRYRYSLKLGADALRTIILSFLTGAGALAGSYFMDERVYIPLCVLGAAVYFYFLRRMLSMRRKSRTPRSQLRQ